MHAEVEDENGRHQLTHRRARLVLHPARRRRQRDDPQRDQPRHARAHATTPTSAQLLDRRLRRRVADTAVEEIVRWATPVIHFRRTATADAVVGGQEIKAGEKVVMFYNSANRDERAFDDPYRFDVRRTPNEHVGFGAGGPHFCLGANLARREIKRDVRGAASAACPTSRSPASPTTCRARSSTASSACRAPGTPSATRRRAFGSKGRTMGQPVVHFEIIGDRSRDSSGATTATCSDGSSTRAARSRARSREARQLRIHRGQHDRRRDRVFRAASAAAPDTTPA